MVIDLFLHCIKVYISRFHITPTCAQLNPVAHSQIVLNLLNNIHKIVHVLFSTHERITNTTHLGDFTTRFSSSLSLSEITTYFDFSAVFLGASTSEESL